MTADNGKMQEETIKTALSVVTTMLSDSDELTRETVRDVARELLDAKEDGHARLYVYIHQAAQLTQLALGIAAMTSGKSIEEVHQALAASIATTDWSDGAYGDD